MSDKSDIAWTDSTWNPVTGCTKVSAGCKHCYAEREWTRLSANPKASDYFDRIFTDVQAHIHRLDQPLRWRRPRRIFVNSMSDLFHDLVYPEFIDQVLAVMMLSPQHTFQVLTKRPERMRGYLADPDLYSRVLTRANDIRFNYPQLHLENVPVDNPTTGFARHIWWGVSVEDQEAADARIPILLETPAAVRWVSLEPLLGPVDLGIWLGPDPATKIAWVVCGGESGPGARVFRVEWAREILRQCRAADVPFFMKQMGAAFNDGRFTLRLRHRAGADPDEWPEDLRVREYPLLMDDPMRRMARLTDGERREILSNARIKGRLHVPE